MDKSLDIYADLRISLNHGEVGIFADGNEIWIDSNLRTLFYLIGFLPSGTLPVRPLDRLLRHIGLTLKYRKKCFRISLLGSKANRWVVSFLSFWFS